MPLPHLALASFATQSIAHSTGFAFVDRRHLRYHFYSDRGLGIGDVAKVQMFFTATFTLGVATLAGAVVLIEPMRLADGHRPAALALAARRRAPRCALVIAYVVWGGFFHRPLRWRGHELVLPSAGATLIQIFFGVADLLAVAAALYVLLPAELRSRLSRGAGRVHGLDRDRPDQPRPGQPRRVRVGGRPAASADRGADPAADRLAAGVSRRLLPAAAGLRRDGPGDERGASLAHGAGAADRSPPHSISGRRRLAVAVALAFVSGWRCCCSAGCMHGVRAGGRPRRRRRRILARRLRARWRSRPAAAGCAACGQRLAATWRWALAAAAAGRRGAR